MVFGTVYTIAGTPGIAWFTFGKNGADYSPFAPFYYSIVTFTTLGFGDVTPKIVNGWTPLIVVFEVILGYIMLGGLISILANKIARRND